MPGATRTRSATVRSKRCGSRAATSSLVTKLGLERKLTWEAGDRLLPERIDTGEESITARWHEVGKGLWLPVDIEFRRVFGRDWGPDTLRLAAVRAR